MASLVFIILKKEGTLILVLFSFLLFSPVYFLDIFLIIPMAFFLLHREMLNLAAPSEQNVILYKLYGLPDSVLLWSNTLMILSVNALNFTLLMFFGLFALEGMKSSDYLNQLLVLNGVLLFALSFGNTMLYYRLKGSAFLILQKILIVPLFFFSVLLIFTILFLLSQAVPTLAAAVFVMLLLIWLTSALYKYDRAEKYL